jgi:RNA polymerase sigma factor (sigma-70 family)
MNRNEWAAEQFEHHRDRLRAVAYRLLGTSADADDAVQEAWLRFGSSDAAAIDNPGGWLTTVVSRVAIDMLRARATRARAAADPEAAERVVADGADPEREAVIADSVGAALMVVLDTLTPSERLAFVLHDSFGVPMEEIAAILGRSTAATKQLASRARSKVRGLEPGPNRERDQHRAIVSAFLSAARNGELEVLVSLLAPDVVLEPDAAAVKLGAPGIVHGAERVARMFSGRALGAEPALVDDDAAMVWIVGDKPKVVWVVQIDAGRITHVEMLAGADCLGRLHVEVIEP